ncbi:hypothetical protein J2129_002126 [Methanofollis sp. W23]|nr:hypothetical protein [Methanofollis sp. W23]MBP2146672.1 hypothetical protein [Methanofollis sp. W23]
MLDDKKECIVVWRQGTLARGSTRARGHVLLRAFLDSLSPAPADKY